MFLFQWYDVEFSGFYAECILHIALSILYLRFGVDLKNKLLNQVTKVIEL